MPDARADSASPVPLTWYPSTSQEGPCLPNPRLTETGILPMALEAAGHSLASAAGSC
jgi:hypothetical protein